MWLDKKLSMKKATWHIIYLYNKGSVCVKRKTQDSFQRWNYSNLLIHKKIIGKSPYITITNQFGNPHANLASTAWRFMGTYGAPKKRRSLGTAKGNLATMAVSMAMLVQWGSNTKSEKKEKVPSWKFNLSPEKVPFQKEHIFSNIIFQGTWEFSGEYIVYRNSRYNFWNNWQTRSPNDGHCSSWHDPQDVQ